MHTDSGMTGISLSGYMPYMTVASLEMSDEPEIIGIKDIKQLVSILYILVTDINPYQNAISSLTQQLNMLANTATDWETVCASKMSQHFTNETKTIKGIKTAFIYCKEFDKFIQTIDSKGNTQSKDKELQEISQ